MGKIVYLRTIIAALALLVSCARTELALAQGVSAPTGLELRGGVLAHDVPGLWSGFRREHGVDINGEVLFGPGLPLLGGYVRPAIGGSVNTVGDTSRGYMDARWEIEGPGGIFFATGLGGAVHNGSLDPTDPDRKVLGSRVLFHIPAELGLRFDQHQSVSIYFEHISNAYLARYNEGLDAIGVRFGYRF